jgi:TonB family protein
MKQCTFLVFALIISAYLLQAQTSDTLYYSEENTISDRSDYSYYQYIEKFPDKNTISLSEFYKNGNTKSLQSFIAKRVEKLSFLEIRDQIKSGELPKNGPQKSYYENGMLKSLETFNKGKNLYQSEYYLENGEPVHIVVDTPPKFPGGDEARLRFLQENVKYPQLAEGEPLSGTVYVSFIVTKTGSVLNPYIIRGASESFNNEALRVVSLCPQWIPGRQDGKAVNVMFNMPIRVTSN